MYYTADYRSAQPTILLASGNEFTAAVSTAALYYDDTGTLWRVTDPQGAATITQLGVVASLNSSVEVDRQTRTLAGCYVDGAILVDDGTTSTALPLLLDPVGLSSSSAGAPSAFEIIVRGG
jgi:hypothetical protein